MEATASSVHTLLRALPAVEHILAAPEMGPVLARVNRTAVVEAVRAVFAAVRQEILSGRITAPVEKAELIQRVQALLATTERSPLRSVVNATGTVLHTNLGRALLAPAAVAEIARVAASPVALEYDLTAGQRGDRDQSVEEDLLALTGAEAATVVNNNAAAVFLALNTLAEGKEGIVSRGELIEIGGTFRLPDVMRRSGVILREVGTTNRTHLRDYAEAITPQTGVLLKVHPSNYRIVGFTSAVGVEELVALGRAHGVPVMEDLGAGALIDLSQYGLPKEPVVAERVAAGVDVVTF
ncbi:MAG: L-seryl-tRNA(Sec) selenium transferase, partial [Candidatus Binatia bacterium]|nr:L-seryl-tRNA(Sec) selenium transferase [Candidatus Binatia bacterium]